MIKTYGKLNSKINAVHDIAYRLRLHGENTAYHTKKSWKSLLALQKNFNESRHLGMIIVNSSVFNAFYQKNMHVICAIWAMIDKMSTDFNKF